MRERPKQLRYAHARRECPILPKADITENGCNQDGLLHQQC